MNKQDTENTAVFRIALIRSCGTFDDVLKDAQDLYDEQRTNFMSSSADAGDLPERAAEWAKASRRLIQAAASEMSLYPAEAERQEKALHIIDICKKDSYLREANLKLHYEWCKGKGMEEKDLRKKRNALLDSILFAIRARNTQIVWVRKFLHGDTYETAEMRYLREHGKDLHEKTLRIPEGHRFYPARVFPPDPVPAGQRVPYPPDAFSLWKELPQEDFVYDLEHDEFVLPKGYVSPDGLIDDESVVFNWEENTVTMKLVGGEPVTWPFWKARKSTDLMEEGSWCEEYQIRVYQQMEEDLAPPGLYGDSGEQDADVYYRGWKA